MGGGYVSGHHGGSVDKRQKHRQVIAVHQLHDVSFHGRIAPAQAGSHTAYSRYGLLGCKLVAHNVGSVAMSGGGACQAAGHGEALGPSEKQEAEAPLCRVG